jgi:uncharacterized RDD family membrane protein YckC
MATQGASLPSAPNATAAAGIARRLASMLYESLLAFAIVFVAGLLFYGAANGRLSGPIRNIFQIYLTIILGLYFVCCWHRGGQTLPMKTWKLRLVSADGGPVSVRQATLRYLLACLSLALAGAGFVWAAFDRDRQFLHDRLAGTRIVRTDR